jgi:hypothetical protein
VDLDGESSSKVSMKVVCDGMTKSSVCEEPKSEIGENRSPLKDCESSARPL